MSRGGGGAPYPRYCNAQGTAGPSFTCELLFTHYSSKEWLGSALLTTLLGSGTRPSNEQWGGGDPTPVTATRKRPQVPVPLRGFHSRYHSKDLFPVPLRGFHNLKTSQHCGR